MHYPPNNNRELQAMLKKLGFVIVSYSRHIKYSHPSRKPTNMKYRPYIVVSHDRGDKTYSSIVIKELKKAYSYTDKEIKDAC
jgi:hypothetical protein